MYPFLENPSSCPNSQHVLHFSSYSGISYTLHYKTFSSPSLTPLVAGRPQSFATLASLQGCFRTWQLAFPRVSDLREWETVCPRQKPNPFSNLILEVTSHHFCPILFIRRESISLATLGDKRWHRDRNASRQGSSGALRDCLPYSFKLSYSIPKFGQTMIF